MSLSFLFLLLVSNILLVDLTKLSVHYSKCLRDIPFKEDDFGKEHYKFKISARHSDPHCISAKVTFVGAAPHCPNKPGCKNTIHHKLKATWYGTDLWLCIGSSITHPTHDLNYKITVHSMYKQTPFKQIYDDKALVNMTILDLDTKRSITTVVMYNALAYYYHRDDESNIDISDLEVSNNWNTISIKSIDDVHYYRMFAHVFDHPYNFPVSYKCDVPYSVKRYTMRDSKHAYLAHSGVYKASVLNPLTASYVHFTGDAYDALHEPPKKLEISIEYESLFSIITDSFKKILKILFVVLKDSIQDLIITFIRLLVVIISEVISVFSAICNDDNIINGIKLAVKDYIRAVHRLVLIIDSDIMFLEILILNAIFHLTYRSSYVTILFFIFTLVTLPFERPYKSVLLSYHDGNLTALFRDEL